MRILFVGDVVGSPGRRVLEALLPGLIEEHSPRFVVVNGENSAGGLGITEKIARGFFGLGVDAITLGNHAYFRSEVFGYLDSEPNIVRPANYPRSDPGHGHTVVEKDGSRLAVVNLAGTIFLENVRNPFAEIDALLEELAPASDLVLVDFHAEATSEKVAMGWHLDGRATACVSTHTHVPTADARVLPGGTAVITDVGMTGPRDGVIGVDREKAIRRFQTRTHVTLDTAEGPAWLNAVLIEAGADGRATAIEQVLLEAP